MLLFRSYTRLKLKNVKKTLEFLLFLFLRERIVGFVFDIQKNDVGETFSQDLKHLEYSIAIDVPPTVSPLQGVIVLSKLFLKF